MRIAVIGAGIVGVTTAYELAVDGHEVAVFERRPSVAAEGSFANAGVAAPGYVAPWASPGMVLKAMSGLLSRHAPVRFGAGSAAASPWLWRFLVACRKTPYLANRSRMQRLALYSASRMETLTQSLRLQFEQTRGLLVLLRTSRDLARAQGTAALLQELGAAHEVVDAARARAIEPGLSQDTRLSGAIHLPGDGVGNCRQLAHLLKARAQDLGAQFLFSTEVLGLTAAGPVEVSFTRGGADPALQARPFDAVVVCAGHQAGRLLAPLGIRVPLCPVYGYSLTAPLRHQDSLNDLGPQSGLIDERHMVALTRLGQRIRVAGIAEIGGNPQRMNPAALRTLYKVLDDWFPGSADLSNAQHWKGARPMLPDGPPLIGPSRIPGVWLNIGHGSSGWALSCGSARLLADLVGARAAAVDAAGFAIERLR